MEEEAPTSPPTNAADATAEAEASEAAWKEDAAAQARRWLLEVSVATLCTSSAQRGIEDYPFGSVVPFALTASGCPIVLIAEIAAHTANLKRDPRASLFVRQEGLDGDPQAGWRLTVMGKMERLVGPGLNKTRPEDVRLSAEALEDIEARYHERVPAAKRYQQTHGFFFWRMSAPVRVRYIAGFGKITWLDGASITRDPLGELAASVPHAIAHMNEDHAYNLKEMCAGLYGISPETAAMVGLDRAGFQVRTTGPDRLLHFSFGREISPGDLRVAVIDVLKRARAAREARLAL